MVKMVFLHMVLLKATEPNSDAEGRLIVFKILVNVNSSLKFSPVSQFTIDL